MNTAYHYPEQLSLVTYPHPALRRPTAAVTVFDQELATFCQAMLAAMRRYQGVGLAAPQVGVSKQIFVSDHAGLDPDADQDSDLSRIWINPRLEDLHGTTVYEEGCLSFPGMYAKVERCDSFTAVWQDVNGTEQRERLHAKEDVLGIVFQHELDHLHGKLFVDHLSTSQLSLLRKRLRQMEQDYQKATGKVGAVLRR